jgi:DNA-binding NtrC family response regulator
MVELIKLIKQVAKIDCDVLITGESGTGNELASDLRRKEFPWPM